MGWPVSASHSRTVLSALPETMRVPSGLNATLSTDVGVAGQRVRRWVGRCRHPTPAPCRRRCRRRCACPSGLNATLYTASVWPVSGAPMGWPVSASHTRTVLVATAGDDARAVGAERHTVHRGRCGRSAGAPIGLAGVGVPHPHACCRRCRTTMRVPVGAERHAVHRAGVAGQRRQVAGVGVPHPHRAVPTAGDDALAVGAKRHTVHPVGVAGERVRRSAGRCRRPTSAPCCRRCRRRCACPSGLNATLNTASVWPVSGCADRLAGVGVPHPHRAVADCRRRCACPSGLNATLLTASVWPVSGCAEGLAGVGVPHPHRAVASCRRRCACRRG